MSFFKDRKPKNFIRAALACAVVAFASYLSTDRVVEYMYGDQEPGVTSQAEQERLGQYVMTAMYKSGAATRLSDAKKQVLARSIVRVADDILVKEDDKKAFITIIAIESGFNKLAQSPTGPKGYGQLSKAAFIRASELCGLKALHEDDVFDEELNLVASACYFREMLENNNGDQYMAMIAYNQGPNSESLKSYIKNGSLNNIEVLKYMARFVYLKKAIGESDGKDVQQGTAKQSKSSK